MTTKIAEQGIQTIQVLKEVAIKASPEIAFEALLEQLGPASEMMGGKPMPMVLEAWPGGRWYRDLGTSSGHLWGHVQVIKPPALLEVCGPLFMSYPAANHVQYRLTAEDTGTRLTLTHRGFGHIPDEIMENVGRGWEYILSRVSENAERLKRSRS
jgi:uncharacterized protein YndB with AHSA1/START domain